MKVKVDRQKLHEAIQVVLGSIDVRSVKPVLQDIRIRTIDGQLELAGTDLEVGTKVIVPDSKIEVEGGVAVSGDRLASIVRESPDEVLSILVEGNTCRIEGAGSDFHIMGEPPEEFPDVADFEGAPDVEIQGGVLKEMARKTSIAAATEKGRYALHGVLLILKKDSAKVAMVATDGRRLARVQRRAAGNAAVDAEVIIPPKAIAQMEKMISDPSAKVGVKVDERRIYFKTETALLTSLLVEGRFPNYEEVIPTGCNKKATIGREALLSAVRRAAVLTSEETRAVKMQFEGKQLTVTSQTPETGDAKIELDVNYSGEPTAINFNPDFLSAWLRVVEDEEIRIEMTEPSQACAMKAGQGCVYVVMPISGT